MSHHPLERLACLSGDGLRSAMLDAQVGPDPASAPDGDDELEARLAPDGLLGGLSTPEACDAYAPVQPPRPG